MYFLRRIHLSFLVFILSCEIIMLIISGGGLQVKYIISPNYFHPLFFAQGGKNLLNFNTAKLARQLEAADPKIKNVTVQKKFPSTLKVSLEKRQPFIVVTDRRQQQQFIADSAGVMFTPADNNTALPLVVTKRISLKAGSKLDTPAEKTALAIIDFLRNKQIEFTQASLTGQKIIIITADTQILFRADAVTPEKLKALQLLLKRFKIEVRQPKNIDLRFTKPIIKF